MQKGGRKGLKGGGGHGMWRPHLRFWHRLFFLPADRVLGDLSSSSSAVDQPCLDPQSMCCQESGRVAQVFCNSAQLVGG